MSYNQKSTGGGNSGGGGGVPPAGPNNVQQVAKTFAGIQQQMQNLVHSQNALPQSSQADLNAFLQQQRLSMFKQQQFLHFQQQIQQQQHQQHHQQQQQQQHQHQQHHSMGATVGAAGSSVGSSIVGTGAVPREPLALTRTPGAADLLNKTYQQQANGNPSTLNQLQQQLQALQPNLMQQLQAIQFQMQNQAKQYQQQQQQQHVSGGNVGGQTSHIHAHGKHLVNQGSLSTHPQQQTINQQPQNPLSTVAGLQQFQQRYLTAAAQAAAGGSKLNTATPPPLPPPLTNQHLKAPHLPSSTQITPMGINTPGGAQNLLTSTATTLHQKGAGGVTALPIIPPKNFAQTSSLLSSTSISTNKQPNKLPVGSGGVSTSTSSNKSNIASGVYSTNYMHHGYQKSVYGSGQAIANNSNSNNSNNNPSSVKSGPNTEITGTALKSPQATPVPLTKQSPMSSTASLSVSSSSSPTDSTTTLHKSGSNMTVPVNTAVVSANTNTVTVTPALPSSPQKSNNLGEGLHSSKSFEVSKQNIKASPIKITNTNDSKSLDTSETHKNVNVNSNSDANSGPNNNESHECISSHKTLEKEIGRESKKILEKCNETSPKKKNQTAINEYASIKTDITKNVDDLKQVGCDLKKSSGLAKEENTDNHVVKAVPEEKIIKEGKQLIELSTESTESKKSTQCKLTESEKLQQNKNQTPKDTTSPTKDNSNAIVITEKHDIACNEKTNKSSKQETTELVVMTTEESPKSLSSTKPNEKILSTISSATTTSNDVSIKNHEATEALSKNRETDSPLSHNSKVRRMKSTNNSNADHDEVDKEDDDKTLQDATLPVAKKMDTILIQKEDTKITNKLLDLSHDSVKSLVTNAKSKDNNNKDKGKSRDTDVIINKNAIATTSSKTTVTNSSTSSSKKQKKQGKSLKANKVVTSISITPTPPAAVDENITSVQLSAKQSLTPVTIGRPKRRSKVESYALDNNPSAVSKSTTSTAKSNNSTPIADRKSQRHRLKTILYQSPLPELAYITKLSASEASNSPKPMSSEDRLIVFYKNEYMAVRNQEGTFYLCQTMQNVYKTSPRISIRWLSEDPNDSYLYVPDFYDHTDIECVLTTVDLKRVDKGHMRLPKTEKTRIESILKKALDVEKGITPRPELTEENPDGLDISLYKDESQIEKKSLTITTTTMLSTVENSAICVETPTPSSSATTGSGRKTRRSGGNNTIISSTLAKSSNNISTAKVVSADTPLSSISSSENTKRGRNSNNDEAVICNAAITTASTTTTPNIRRSRGKKHKTMNKRKRKVKASNATSDEDLESSDNYELDTDYKPNRKRSTLSSGNVPKAMPRAQRSPLAKARAASPIAPPTSSKVKNVPQNTTPTSPSIINKTAASNTTPITSGSSSSSRSERASKRKAADISNLDDTLSTPKTLKVNEATSTITIHTNAAITTTTAPSLVAKTTNNAKAITTSDSNSNSGKVEPVKAAPSNNTIANEVIATPESAVATTTTTSSDSCHISSKTDQNVVMCSTTTTVTTLIPANNNMSTIDNISNNTSNNSNNNSTSNNNNNRNSNSGDNNISNNNSRANGGVGGTSGSRLTRSRK